MKNLFTAFAEKPLFALAIAAFLTGVSLFYLVMQRTRRKRIMQAESAEHGAP